MKQTSNKKAVKGMTLIEIIIAMVVFAVCALILVQVGESINAYHKNSVRMNRKVTIEEPFVVNGNKDTTIAGEAAKAKKIRIKIDSEAVGHDLYLNGEAYTSKKTIDGKNAYLGKTKDVPDANLQFIDVPDATVKYKKDKDGKLMKDKDGHYVIEESGNLYSDPDPGILVDAESPKENETPESKE